MLTTEILDDDTLVMRKKTTEYLMAVDRIQVYSCFDFGSRSTPAISDIDVCVNADVVDSHWKFILVQ